MEEAPWEYMYVPGQRLPCTRGEDSRAISSARESRESFKPSQLTSVPRAVRGLNATYGSDEKAKPDVAYSRPLRFDRVARRMRMESLWLDRIHRGYLAALQCFSCHMSSDRAEEASIGMIGTL